jgi:hypothetical protein
MVGKTRNLAVTGIDRFSCRVLTEKKGLRGNGSNVKGRNNSTEGVDEIPVGLEKRSVTSLLGDVLRASEVDVYGIAMGLHDFGRCEELFWVVCAELDDERPVFGSAFFAQSDVETLFTVGFL